MSPLKYFYCFGYASSFYREKCIYEASRLSIVLSTEKLRRRIKTYEDGLDSFSKKLKALGFFSDPGEIVAYRTELSERTDK